jgi:hypothetical protein
MIVMTVLRHSTCFGVGLVSELAANIMDVLML